jgi:tripartite ATP-independent transporter DctM subunit
MNVELLTLLMFGSFFLLLAIGIPLAWSLLSLGLLFGLVMQGPAIFSLLIYRTWDLIDNFALIAIPMFIFMANMLRYSGIADELYHTIHIWLSSLRGGMAIATVVVCTFLAAMVGTVGAGVTIMGLIALPAMLKRNYNKSLVLGSIIGGGSLGIMIPPSITFIFYGVFAGLSIGKLFMGGVFTGLVLSGLFIAYIAVRSYLQPDFAPSLPKEERAIPFTQKLARTGSLILPFLLILGVLGSIYLGVATPSEAAGVGAAGAMIAAAVRRQLTWQNLKLSLFSTLRIVGIIMWIAFGAYFFVGVYIRNGGADFATNMLLTLELGKWGTLIVILFILLILGMVLDPTGITVLTVPIFVPVIKALGLDPIWFAVLFNIAIQIAFLSPPFGLGMFYLKAVAPPEISMGDIYRAVVPFILLQIIGLALTMIFPPIAIWLPNQMIK